MTILSVGINLVNPLQTSAAVSNNINFQARLEGSNGAIAADGNYNVEFKLYKSLAAGSSAAGVCAGGATDDCLWKEDYLNSASQGVRVVNGYLTVNLGSITAFPASMAWDQSLYITMNIGGTGGAASYDGEMSPRLKLTAVPYAFQSKSASQLQVSSGANVGTLSFTTPTATDNILLPDASGTVCLNGATACGFAASSGSGAYIQNGTGLQSTANFNIRSAATTSVTATIQALASQTADLLRFENSGGTAALSGFNSSGQLYYQSGSFTGTIVQDTLAQTTVYHLPDPGSASDTFCLLIKANCTGGTVSTTGGTQNFITKYNNAGATQITNSQLFDNGTNVGLNVSTGFGTVARVTVNSNVTADNAATAQINTGAAANKGLVIQGFGTGTTPNQTADLLQVQSSTGAILDKIDSTGNLTAGTINTATISGGTLSASAVNGLNVSSSAIDTTAANPLSIGATNATLTIGNTGKLLTLQGNSSSVITATSGANTTTVNFQTPIANVTFQFPATTVGSYNICTSSGNCLGGGGGGANTALSNLNAVAINASLLPAVNNSIDVGSATLAFRAGYFATSLQAPLLQTAATSTASTNSLVLALTTGNASGATSNSGNISIDTGTATGSTGTISLGTANASGITIGRSGVVTSLPGGINTGSGNITTTAALQGGTAIVTAASGLTLGTSSTATGGLVFKGSGGAGTLSVVGPTTPNAGNFTLSIPAITANANICTDNSVCSGYAAASGGNYIAKNTNDTSSAAFVGNLLGLTNTSTAAAGVLGLTNSGTNSGLSIIQSGTSEPSAGQALILANNNTTTPTGNLLDLQNKGTSKFSVDASGNTTVLGTLAVTGTSTYTGLGIFNGGLSVAANQNLTLSSGTGTYTQTYASSGTGSFNAHSVNATNSNATATATTLNAQTIGLTGTASGANTLNGLNFSNVTAIAGNTFNALNIGTGYNDILRYNGSQLISGTGLLQNAAIDSTLTYSNLQKVGALSVGSIASGFGTISTTNNITTTAALQGGTAIVTAASGLTLGTSSTATGGLVFKGSGGAGTLSVVGPTTPNAGNFTLSIPAITANANICTDNSVCSGYAAASALGAYVQLAPSAVQLDSSTNSSIFINKTGASGNILQLQNGGVDQLVVANNGALTVSQLLTANLGATVTGAAVNLNAGATVASNFNTAINSGTSTGTIAIGNSASTGFTLESGTATANLFNGATAHTINLATGAAVNGITIGSTNSTSTTTLQAGSGNLNFNTTQAQFSEVTGTRTLTAQTRSTNLAGTALTISGGTAGAGAAAFSGGLLTLQGGNAAGTGNANGANVALQGGTGIGTGVQGLVTLASTALTASTTETSAVSFTISQAKVDNNSTIPVNATAASITVTVPAPTINTVGRLLYITVVNGSNSITLAPVGGATSNLNANATATLIWNGFAWTNAGLDGGSSAYIQNQNAADQTANFRITGVGQANSGFLGSSLDVVTATSTLSIGTAAGNGAITLGRSGITTTNNGALTVTQLGTFNGSLTVATGNTFTNASSSLFTAIAIGNLDYSGSGNTGAIGTAAATVNVATSFTIAQTTAGQTLTIPSPTVTTAGRIIYISNIGTASFTMLGSLFPSGASATMTWNGTSWQYAGSGGSAIENQNAANQIANFRITGSGQANTSFLSPLFDVATAGTLSLGTVTANGITLGSSGVTTTNAGNITINGTALLKTTTDSASAFQIQNNAGTSSYLFNAATTTGNITTNQGSLSINGVATPATPTLTTTTAGGGLPGATTYSYKLAATNIGGSISEAVASNPSAITTGNGTSNNLNTLTWTAVTGAQGYKIYRTSNGGTNWFVNSVAAGTTSIVDDGTNFTWATAATPPTSSSTGGISLGGGTAITFNANNGGNVMLQASSSATTSYVLRLPSLQGGTNTVLLNDGNGNLSWSTTSGCSSCLVEIPTSTAQNTITPTAASVVALTVNGTSGTAADAMIINQSGAANGVDLNLTNTAGTQANGFLINRNGTGGTTTNALQIQNTAGTLTNGIVFSGVIGTDIATAASRGIIITANAASTISTTAGNLTLQAGSGTVSLGSSTSLLANAGLTVAAGGTGAFLAKSADSTTASTGAVTLKSGDATTGTNLSSGNITIDSGTKTGTGTAGSISIGTVNSLSITIGNSSSNATVTTQGLSLFKPISDNTAAFQLQNAGGTTVLLADTTNSVLNAFNSVFITATGAQTPNAPSASYSTNINGALVGTSGTTHYFKVAAVNNLGESVASAETSVAASTFAAIAAPPAPSATPTCSGIGTMTGAFVYVITYITPNGETTSGAPVTSSTCVSNASVSLTGIPTFTSDTTAVTSRKVYKCAGAGCSNYGLIGTIADDTTTTFTDNNTAPGAATPVTNTALTNHNKVSISFTLVSGATSYKVYHGTASGSENFLTSGFSTSPAIYTGVGETSGATPLTTGSGGSLGIGVNAPSRSLDVKGSVGGNVVIDNQALTATPGAAIVESTPALAYHLTNTTGTTSSVTPTVTFNITGVPNVDGTLVTVVSEAIKGASAFSSTSTVTIQINGTQISTVNVTGTAAGQTNENYIAMRTNGVWRIVAYGNTQGAANTSTSDTADFAEWIHYSSAIKPQAGQLLTVGDGPVSVKISGRSYDTTLIGVVSTSPYQVASVDDGHSVILALAGRVPVNVNLENGPIKAGDPLTSSSTPGVSMKATAAGKIIGTALESYDGTSPSGQIMVSLHPGYNDPSHGTNIQGDTSVSGNLNLSGNAQVKGDLNVTGSITTAALNVTGSSNFTSLNVSGSSNLGGLVVGGTANIANLLVGGMATVGNLTATGTTSLNNLTVGGAANLASLNVSGSTILNSLTVSTAQFLGQVYIGNNAGGVLFATNGNAFEPLLIGTARHHVSVALTPAFPGAVLDGGTSNIGNIAAGFCSHPLNINTSLCSGTSDEHNFYGFSAPAADDYHIWTRWQVPSNWNAFATNAFNFSGHGDSSTEITVVTIYNGSTNCGSATITGSGTWTGSNIDTLTCGPITPGATFLTIDAHLKVGIGGHSSHLGEYTFNYLSSY